MEINDIILLFSVFVSVCVVAGAYSIIKEFNNTFKD